MNFEKIKNYFIPQKILDIGANIGGFYIRCKKVFPECYYVLIEGNDFCDPELAMLGVEYHILLLSDVEKEVDFYIRKKELQCTGNSIYREKTPFFDDEEIIIEKKKTTVLDNLVLPDFDLIKIDVQGSEIDVIKGGINMVSKCKGIIMEVSLEQYNEGAMLKEEAMAFMQSIGYKASEVLGVNMHPVRREKIQEDILFINQNI